MVPARGRGSNWRRPDRDSTAVGLLDDPNIKALLPSFIRASRDLNHFWSYIKGKFGQWEPRRVHVRDAMTPLMEYLEGANKAPVDSVVSDVLQIFDVDVVHRFGSKRLNADTPIPREQ